MPFGLFDYCYMGCQGRWLCDDVDLRSNKAPLPVASYMDQQIASITFVVTIVTMPIVRINHVIITTGTPIHYTLRANLVKSG